MDHFGNAITNIRREQLSAPSGALRVDVGSDSLCGPVESYAGAAVGEALVIWGSAGFLELAVREGSAAAALGIGRGDAVWVRGAGPPMVPPLRQGDGSLPRKRE